MSNSVQARDGGSNSWTSPSYPYYGNYWGGWTSPDADRDGIVDSPYVIDGDSQDMYPLAIPLSSFDVEITSPANGTTVYTSNVLVTGTAAPGYWLDVNGFLVNVKDDGTFSIVLSLPEGENTIEARSTALFLEASGSVTITYVDQPQQDLEDARSRLAEVTAQLESARA